MVMFLCLVMETMGNWDKELINHGKERGRERERGGGGGGERGEGGRDEEKGEKKENRYWKGMVEEERLNYFFYVQ